MRGGSRRARGSQSKPRRKAKAPEHYLFAWCVDRSGKQRKVTIWPDGDTFYLKNDFESPRRLAHSSRPNNENGYRDEIAAVYQYTIERFEDPELERQRKMEALRGNLRARRRSLV
jgi:hypothetical protein